MVQLSNLMLSFGKKILFKDVNLKFTPGNCYGLIGANGSGKSTFLKVISGEIEPNSGEIAIGKNLRIAILRQDQFAFDKFSVIDTVIQGHKKLYEILEERENLYSKPEFTEEDGRRASELEELTDIMNGYEAQADASKLLSGLGVPEELLKKTMGELDGSLKVRALLAQALFGNPDILLLDEPTNHLDIESITWLENFLYDFKNTVIIVSHDRHFINKVCTHIADIDFSTIKIYTGNYDFWLEASQLSLKQKKEENKKKEELTKDLQSFIARFSANASKSRQATSRKKLLEKITIDEIPVSSRRIPYIAFKPDRDCGARVLSISGLNIKIDGDQVIRDFDLVVEKGDKIAFFGYNSLAKTELLKVIVNEIKPHSGLIKWGETIKFTYYPRDNSAYFEDEINLIEWFRQYSRVKDETSIRGFLGRMLFSGDETLKTVNVLSGGEKARCMFARMMHAGANLLVFDEPTNHLDLESISALNNGMNSFTGCILFTTHDHQLISTVANRIIEITPAGIIDRRMNFEEYIESTEVHKERDRCYRAHQRLNMD